MLILIGGIILSITIAVIGLFIGNIIIFESIGFAIAAGTVSSQLLNIHPAISLIIGIAVFIAFFLIHKTKFGFWIVSIIMSLAWGLLAAVIAYSGTHGDMIWTYVVWGLGAIIAMFLHTISRENLG